MILLRDVRYLFNCSSTFLYFLLDFFSLVRIMNRIEPSKESYHYFLLTSLETLLVSFPVAL